MESSRSRLKSYLLQALNMALQIQGETSYTNSFNIEVERAGFYFIPRVPTSYIINNDLYQKIYAIASATLYPRYTLLKQSGAYFVPMPTDNIHTQRALFFPWLKGIPTRLNIDNIELFMKSLPENTLPLLKNLSLNYDKVTSIAIAGNSGSGKSYHLVYWLNVLKNFSDLVIIDPKFDSPSRWAKFNNVKVVAPDKNRSKSDTLSEVNNTLKEHVDLIHERQQILYENPKKSFKHATIVIDELMALTTGVQKQIKDAFFSLLSEIALMGRATKVHLLMVSQRFEANALPVSVREQCNVLIQLGNINRKTTQFLFPDLDKPEDIVTPAGLGTGLIQIIDGEHPPNVMPYLTATFNEKEGVF